MDQPTNIAELHERASRPNEDVLNCLRNFDGDVLVIGAGGKMGFHLSAMVHRGLTKIASSHRLTAVSRFSAPHATDLFDQYQINTLSADLTDDNALRDLPDAQYVFFLAGVKFGTANDPELLQQMNVELPKRVAARFADAKIIALSTGCVYAFATPASGGSVETDSLDPPGQYAKSCLGREAALINSGVDVSLIRLNYSVDLRYGVLVDLALKVFHRQPVDVSTGYFNVIWQGDANRYIIRAAEFASSNPPYVLNVTGKQTLRVRDVALRFGELFEQPVELVGEEAESAWLNNAGQCHRTFGEPEISEQTLLDWVAHWIRSGGELLNKPTHFEVRDGKY